MAAIVESSDDAIISGDLNGIVTSWNKAAEKIFGFTSSQMVGTPIHRIIPTQRRMEEVQIFDKIKKGEIVAHMETQRQTNDGRLIDVNMTVSPIKDIHGKVVGISKISRDITLAKVRDMEVKRVSRLYVALCEVNHAIVKESTAESLFEKVCSSLVQAGEFNLAWVSRYKSDGKVLIPLAAAGDHSQYILDLSVNTDGSPQSIGPTALAFRENRTFVANDLFNDPSVLPWRDEIYKRNFRACAAFPILEKGKPTGTLTVYAGEVGFFRAKEIELLETATQNISFALDHLTSVARYRALFQYAPDGIVIADSRSTYLDANNSIGKMLGYQPSELIGMNAADIVVSEEIPQIEIALADIKDTASYHREWQFKRKDQSVFSAEVIATTLPDGNIMGMIRDITERKTAQKALQDLNEGLEAKVAERTEELQEALARAKGSDQLKSAFLATMSHELRTPLNSIIGFTGIVLQQLAGPLNAEQTKQLGMVRSSSRHLLELINDILDLSKIEANQLEVFPDPFDLKTSLQEVVASLEPLASKKGLSLELKIAGGVSEVSSDRRRVEQVVLNLLNNAIKFTMKGGVTITADINENLWRIQVTDTGIGIKAADLELLFLPFRQIDSSLSRQHEGTGLGLAICRKLAALLGGEISAASNSTGGMTFAFTLPVRLKGRA